MKIDTAKVNFVNQIKNTTVYVWTHYQECYKCDYLPIPFVLNYNKTFEKEFTSDYTLKYAITKENNSHFGILCNGTVPALDQSIYNLTIASNTSVECTLSLIKAGRNNMWPLLGTIAVVLSLATLFYSVRYLYQKKGNKKETDGIVIDLNDEALKNKLSQRLNCLDAFRGMTIMMMIFCNWGGGYYGFLEHIEWDGLHFADVIFPFFVFIMGASMAISLRNQVLKKNIPTGRICKQIFRRTVKLFILGLAVNSVFYIDLTKLRILGVLQRFGISYLLVALAHVYSLTKSREQLCQPAASRWSDLLPYWPEWTLVLAMMAIYFPVTYLWAFDPHCPVGYVGVGGFSENGTYANCTGGAANRIDKLLFTEAHIYPELLTGGELYDPEVGTNKTKMYNIQHDCEGVLGYTTSILLTVLGLQAGKIMTTYSEVRCRLIRLAAWTVISGIFTAALAVPGWVPINKNLWSFTFATVNATLAFAIFTVMYLLIDHFKVWPLGHPLHYPGMNAIFLYMGHVLAGGTFPFYYYDNSQSTSHLWPMVQVSTALFLWLLISVYVAKKRFFLTL